MDVQANKDLIRRYNEEIWSAHNLERIDEFIHPDLLEEATGHVEQFLDAFPDAHITIEDLIGEADRVVARLYATATNTGPFAGQPPTGKKVEIRSIRIYRIDDGKIAESWAMQNRLELMQQLGLVQSTAGDVNWAAGEED